MDKIEIPECQIISLDGVAPGIRGLRITFVNVFGVHHADHSWTLIDAALPMTDGIIRRWAEKHFSGPPNCIILSHGHFDHVSAAKSLADHWNVPVYAHSLERPYLTGQSEYPAPNPGAGGGMMSVLSPTLPRGPIDLGDRLHDLPSDAGLNGNCLPGWQILHTPGHTPGHISFFRPEDRTLLPGDAFCTTKSESFFEAAVAQKAELHGPPSYFTSDWNAARDSVRKLAELNPLTIAAGHGQPISGPVVAAELCTLAERFDQIAIPDNKKFSAQAN
jgi:glyoxylase-like metal-dependent hydrolase (beta-lactamase superfamily II)